ncbi:PREDICTED: fibronectin type 3 and ankyrin repeat domains protein 1 [Myotis brandtii]|uniref:fibronectin type 3 and ankyrin repeat domains protein 1 n=1 Tax=Myotis brandtii TaxID=109478 RepID=UPI00070464E6|nr:PREDICTED: fibronectin type 3 and ankyrin repeat domains protein 1 [Myotis brandtii]
MCWLPATYPSYIRLLDATIAIASELRSVTRPQPTPELVLASQGLCSQGQDSLPNVHSHAKGSELKGLPSGGRRGEGGCDGASVVPVTVTAPSASSGEPMSSEHLHRAVNVNDEELLLGILRGGTVKVDVPNRLGFTALMVAAQKGYTRLVKILISYGTDVNLRNGSGKDRRVRGGRADGSQARVPGLCPSGSFSSRREVDGFILLRFKEESLQKPSDARADCTKTRTPAPGAFGPGQGTSLSCPVASQVDAMDAGSGWTPLMRVSAISGSQRVASLLIEAGADVNVKDKDGKTPLMVAVLNNHEELVQLLLDKGADANVRNEFGKGVLDMARVFDRQNMVFLLEERRNRQEPKKSLSLLSAGRTPSVAVELAKESLRL